MNWSLIEAVEKSGGGRGPYGELFGKLVVLHLDHNKKRTNGDSRFYDLCQCDCGNKAVVRRDFYLSGATTSCGCVYAEMSRKMIANSYKHHLCHHNLYLTRIFIIRYCYNDKSVGYPSLGGKGIQVCDRWRESIENFVADVEAEIGPRPTIGTAVFSRIDEKGNFEPGNICWKQQEEIGARDLKKYNADKKNKKLKM